MKDDMRYTPSDCFETFPFPENFETNERLEAVGKEYYEFRAQLMIANNEGLTKTYNRFHDPYERSPEIQKLRELHDAMDRAVLDAYGWTDLVPYMRVPPGLRRGRGRRRRLVAPQKALALPLARRRPRRSAGAPAGLEHTACRTGTPDRPGCRGRWDETWEPTALTSERRHTAAAPARRGAPPAGVGVVRAFRIVTSSRGRERMEPVHVRHQLVDALRLDLVGPEDGLGDAQEILPQRPSTWYMTGFLVPLEASPDQKTDAQGTDELDAAGDAGGLDDAATPEPAAARVSYLPSSIGASVLVPAAAQQLTIMVRWGDYHMRAAREDEPGPSVWERTPREERVLVTLPAQTAQPLEVAVPQSGGLMVDVAVRPVLTPTSEGGLPPGTRSVSVFLVNRRAPAPDERSDDAFAFQAQLAIHGDRPFVPRPDLRSLESQDWDERVADLHYRDAFEFAVGHSVATAALLSDDQACWTVHTCWIPEADVERVAPSQIDGVELSMDTLGHLTDAADAHAKLGALVTQYHAWIEAQRRTLPALPAQRRETAEELLHRATVAAQRIAYGVQLLADPVVLTAFRLANRAMAAAARQRFGVMQGKDPATVQPQWRPFQLAFLLMNLPGMVQPEHADREVVDLLFFPTGGGKTEAYLGLAAFTLVLRRLRHPGLASAGLSVLMRYTLRLLTLDQLGRAATLLCALELERQQDVETLGDLAL